MIAEESYLLVLDIEQVYTMPEIGAGLEICLIRPHPRQLWGKPLVASARLASVHRVPYVSVHLWPPVNHSVSKVEKTVFSCRICHFLT